MLFGWPVYQPPAFFWWWFAYDAYAHGVFVEGAYIAASSGVAAIVVAVSMSVWRAREVKEITTYGSARWAVTSEVRRAGLLQHDGVLLGQWHGAAPIFAMMVPSMCCDPGKVPFADTPLYPP